MFMIIVGDGICLGLNAPPRFAIEALILQPRSGARTIQELILHSFNLTLNFADALCIVHRRRRFTQSVLCDNLRFLE